MQFQADILNIPIIRASDEDTTAFGGAAVLAGLAVGFWKDIDEIKGFVETGRLFKPDMAADRRSKLYRGWKAAVAATRTFRLTDLED